MNLYSISSSLTALALFSFFSIYSMKEITSTGELHTALENKQPVLIFFYTSWCGVCKSMHTPLNQLAEQFKKDVMIVKVNADNEKCKEAVDYFGVDAIPTLVIKHVGLRTKEQLKRTITSLIEKPASTQKKEEPKKPAAAQKKPQAPAKQEAQKKNTQPPQKKKLPPVAPKSKKT